MSFNLKNRHFLSLEDYNGQELHFLLSLASELKRAKYAGVEQPRLQGKNIALIFEKTSTRTRCAFEVAAYDQGANVTYIGPSTSQISVKESIKDTARVLGRLYDAIEYRGFDQKIVNELATYANVPVWNGLTTEYHPTQILADFLTMQEHHTKPLNAISFCYLGNGRSNMGDSLLQGAAKMGMDFRMAAPKDYRPPTKLIERCLQIAETTGAKLVLTDDIEAAVKGVDFIYTDVWVSMGEPDSVWEERIHIFLPYQVNSSLLQKTGNKAVKFMHCLPAYHNRATEIGEKIYQKFGLDGMEVTEEVFESPASIVFDQAENRLHTIKAVMVAIIGA